MPSKSANKMSLSFSVNGLNFGRLSFLISSKLSFADLLPIYELIVFGVKAVSSNDPAMDPATVGTEVKTEALKCPSAPTATNVRIVGDPYPGKMLTGKYDYSHELDIGEGESEYRWLMFSQGMGGFTVIGTESTLVLNNSHVGNYIKFSVKPCASDDPKDGKEVESQAIYITSAGTSSGLSGSGGGITVSSGGGGGSSSSSKNNNKDKTERIYQL